MLATAFGLPGLRSGPGADIPAGSAFSQARNSGEQVMQRLFELDAAVGDADLGISLPWKGLEVTAIDGTTMELARNGVPGGEFGTPADGARPLLRITAHVRTATSAGSAPRSAATTTARTPWPTSSKGASGPASEPRRPRLLLHGPVPAELRRGAHLAWRCKGRAKPVPLKTLERCPTA